MCLLCFLTLLRSSGGGEDADLLGNHDGKGCTLGEVPFFYLEAMSLFHGEYNTVMHLCAVQWNCLCRESL